MKTRSLTFLIALLFIGDRCFPQAKKSNLQPIEIGSKAPGYTLKGLINYPVSDAKLTDFKGKILILDFWTFGCAACVESWPKLLKLQEKFNDKIQIVLVNNFENEHSVKRFLDKREDLFGYRMTLPIACGDKQMRSLFPYQSVPHVVFIDAEGTVKYISEGAFLNEETIGNMIKGNELKIPERINEYVELNPSKPLFMNGNVGKKETGENAILSSVITPYSTDIYSSIDFGRWENRSYGWIGSFPLKDMFRILYGDGTLADGSGTRVPNAQILLKMADSSKYVYEINEITRPENTYSIQFTAKRDMSVDHIKRKMITDLEQCFGLKSEWEKQLKKCLVISRSKSPITEYKKGSRQLDINYSSLNINNVTVKEFTDCLLMSLISYYKNFSYPIVDESGFKGKLGKISFEGNIKDYKKLGEMLDKYGLEFSIQEREVPVLVVSDQK